MTPPDLSPAFAAFLCIALAGVLLGGCTVVLRLVALSRHHLERLAVLQALEVKLSKVMAAKLEKIDKLKKATEVGAKKK